MAVKVIAMYEDGWLSPNADFRMWDLVCRAYGAELQMVNAWTEAIIPANHELVLFSELGTETLADLRHPNDAVYGFGRSQLDLSAVMASSHVVRIEVPFPVTMFGVSAVAIALEDRRRRWQSP